MSISKRTKTIIVSAVLLGLLVCGLYTVATHATATAAPHIVHSQTPKGTNPLAITFTQANPGTVSVHTLAGATLTIKVLYACSMHYATSKSLQGIVTADIHGNYTWSWMVQSRCHGVVTPSVKASANGKSISNQTTFND